MRDPYEVLGVPRSASAADIKSAFRRLAKKHHTDANKHDPKASERFAEINAAYEIVGDEAKRKAFDSGEIDAEGKPKFQGFEGFGAQPGGGPEGAYETFTFGPEGFQRATGRGDGFGGFEDILKKEPDNAHAHFGLGIIFRYQSKPDEAAPHFEAVTRIDPNDAASWYWQRGWIEQSFKDSKGRFGLAEVMVGCPKRLSRLLMALTVALEWLTLMGLPEVGVMPRGWHAAVAQRGRASVISLALALLDKLGNIPPSCLPRSLPAG